MKPKVFRTLEKKKDAILNVLLEKRQKRFDLPLEALSKRKQAKILKQLKKEEATCFFRFYKHPIIPILKVLNIFVVMAPFVLFYRFFLQDQLSPFASFSLGVVLLLVTLGLILRVYGFWRINSYFIDEEGLTILSHPTVFSDEFEQIPHERISILNADQSGFFQIVLNYGDLVISSIITDKEGAATTVLKNIYAPKERLKKIDAICDRYRDDLTQLANPVLHHTGLDTNSSGR